MADPPMSGLFDPGALTLGAMADGTPRQREAVALLEALGLFDVLAAFRPVLAGTVPLDIDVEGSDLDILCQASDFDALERALHSYRLQPGFAIQRVIIRDRPTLLASWPNTSFPIELFAQNRPVLEQEGFRHLIVEARLLAIGGEPLREAIRALKHGGLKTEPAFARWLGLAGDPYDALLELESWGDEALWPLVSGAGSR